MITPEIVKIANDLLFLDFYNAADEGATVESIIQDITNDPISIIKFLIETIDI